MSKKKKKKYLPSYPLLSHKSPLVCDVPKQIKSLPKIKSAAKKYRGNPLFVKGQSNPYSEKLKKYRAVKKLKINHHLTPKQATYVRSVVLDKTTKVAALEKAGYGRTVTSDVVERSAAVRNALTQAMIDIGVDTNYIAAKLKEGLNATETKLFAYEGKVIDTRVVQDYSTREKYARDVLEVNGFIRNQHIDSLNIGLISLPEMQDISEWNKNVDSRLECELKSSIPVGDSAVNSGIQ